MPLPQSTLRLRRRVRNSAYPSKMGYIIFQTFKEINLNIQYPTWSSKAATNFVTTEHTEYTEKFNHETHESHEKDNCQLFAAQKLNN